MLELRVVQSFEGTWELWVNQTCVASEFVTKEAAWNYALRHLAQYESREEREKDARERGDSEIGKVSGTDWDLTLQ